MRKDLIQVEIYHNVALLRLNRPEVLNALSSELMNLLGDLIEKFDRDPSIGALILTGGEKVFAAGADISQMASKSYEDCFSEDFITKCWDRLLKCRKPLIAAVAGYALGGGCEIALMCDFILAADNAQFGQPEILIGTIPGAGGSQRLARFIGKSKAMEMCLTGRRMGADEAERCGLVSRVLPLSELIPEALKVAQTIAEMPRAQVMMIKESINQAYETPLSAGLKFERRLFHSTFATEDQKEGMKAFLEKRKPVFKKAP